jgi:hypothetical protein
MNGVINTLKIRDDYIIRLTFKNDNKYTVVDGKIPSISHLKEIR